MKHISEFNGLLNIPYETYKLRKKEYISTSLSVDIETTSTYVNNEKVAFPYIWTIGIGGVAYYTRRHEEFIAFMRRLSGTLTNSNLNIICLIQNFAFEFAFMSNWFDFENVFAVDKNKPIKAEWGAIEFRCSYILSNRSLSKIASDFCKTQKMVGDLDYSIYRDSTTPLTPTEFKYCENDVIILNEYWDYLYNLYIKGKSKPWLPLTSTGVVRHYCKSKIPRKGYMKYSHYMESLFPTEELYDIMQRCFWGAYVHACHINAGYWHYNTVHSFDYTSDYPFQIIARMFPMTRFIKISPKNYIKYDDEHYAKLMKITLVNLRSVHNSRILSVSKLLQYDTDSMSIDNGRVIDCDLVTFWCTELDYQSIRKFYSCDKAYIEELWVSKKGRLPKYLVKSVVHYYAEKNRLKEVVKKLEFENAPDSVLNEARASLQKSKNELNSLYGMMVSALNMSLVKFDNIEFEWYEEEKELVYNREFLAYQWGIYVTAHARKSILDAVYLIGDDNIYTDTDSIKLKKLYKHMEVFENQNAEIETLLIEACNYYDIDYELVKGIGAWDWETKRGAYSSFKTLGSKRYCANGKTVISGISQIAVEQYAHKRGLSVNDVFNAGLYIPPDETNKNTVCYRYSTEPVYINDEGGGYWINNYVHLEPQEYSMNLSSDYKKILDKARDVYQCQYARRKKNILDWK